jgi:pSer/pThr/pTyr-binding forkhead associated (FHA) protein
MAKLVVLSAGMTGRTQELKVEKTTIGRVEDNTFQIAEPSVSSHHCEVLLRGSEVVVRDLNSTNGTFINGEKIAEKVIKPGQILRLGQIEMRLETDAPTAPAQEATRSNAGHAARRQPERTGARHAHQRIRHEGLGLLKEDDKGSKIFWIVAALVGLAISEDSLYALTMTGK